MKKHEHCKCFYKYLLSNDERVGEKWGMFWSEFENSWTHNTKIFHSKFFIFTFQEMWGQKLFLFMMGTLVNLLKPTGYVMHQQV